MANIALVDDDRNILTSVSIALEAEGHKINTYTDGASALEGLRAKQADLAILDIKMPRMDGMELLRRLREKSKMPVIFLTSKEAEVDEIFGLKMGADDFITKPFSQKVLVERVKTVLKRTAARNNVRNIKEIITQKLKKASRRASGRRLQRLDEDTSKWTRNDTLVHGKIKIYCSPLLNFNCC